MLQSHIPYIFWQEWKSKPWKVLECVQVNTEFAEFHVWNHVLFARTGMGKGF